MIPTPKFAGPIRAWLAGVFLPLAAGLCAHADSAPAPVSAPTPAMHTLSNAELQVDVMDPNAPDRYYRGPRFSPVANVLRVRMAGRSFLFAPDAHDPMTENGGLAMEFDIGTEPNPPPPGFNEARAGDGFLKIGVGVLRKEADPLYKFYAPYVVTAPSATTVEWQTDRARFQQASANVSGYAYRLEAEVNLVGNELRIACRLTNTGEKPFSTEQYAHNFFAFDEHPVAPGIEVEFPYDFDVRLPKPVIVKRGHSLTLAGEITPKIKAAQAFVTPSAPLTGPDTAIVRLPSAGMQIRATVSRPASLTVVHFGPRYVCPEQFVRIALQPGETAEWERAYEFQILPSSSAQALLPLK